VVEESPSIFEWRGFPVSKKIIHFRCDADAIGTAEMAMPLLLQRQVPF
jgi:hypothetical protein